MLSLLFVHVELHLEMHDTRLGLAVVTSRLSLGVVAANRVLEYRHAVLVALGLVAETRKLRVDVGELSWALLD